MTTGIVVCEEGQECETCQEVLSIGEHWTSMRDGLRFAGRLFVGLAFGVLCVVLLLWVLSQPLFWLVA